MYNKDFDSFPRIFFKLGFYSKTNTEPPYEYPAVFWNVVVKYCHWYNIYYNIARVSPI